jgi:hypothetical protein
MKKMRMYMWNCLMGLIGVGVGAVLKLHFLQLNYGQAVKLQVFQNLYAEFKVEG